MEKIIYVIIGCDTDPDRNDFLNNLPSDTLSWRGMLEGIPRAKEELQNTNDSYGNEPIFTWCLRADYQIKKIYGSYNYIIREHQDFLIELEQSGDELGWHPHFWKDDNSQWYQECFDVNWQTEMLKNAHAEFMEIFPERAKSVRMGWDYHNNNTFSTLQELGVNVDFSGIPGLKIKPKEESTRSVNFFDWSLTPNNPYFPSKQDYRREVKDNEKPSLLLESPNYVSKSIIWGFISGLVLSKKMKDIRPLLNAFRRPTYWINITGKPKLFAPIIDQAIRMINYEKKIFFVTYFHPDELLNNRSSLYSLNNLVDNIFLLTSTANNYGIITKFIPAKDIRKYI
jgi:hypothetical protein